MLEPIRFFWNATRGHRLRPWRSEYLRWRLETFGLYMPSLPEARPWWRVNARAARALSRQLPGYARWLADMEHLRTQGARDLWRARSGTDARDWERWLNLGD